jgi:hypothetical protein
MQGGAPLTNYLILFSFLVLDAERMKCDKGLTKRRDMMKAALISHVQIQEEESDDCSKGIVTVEIDIGAHGAACTVYGHSFDEAVRRAVIIADAFIAQAKKDK